jgi:hypothetical protein
MMRARNGVRPALLMNLDNVLMVVIAVINHIRGIRLLWVGSFELSKPAEKVVEHLDRSCHPQIGATASTPRAKSE